MPRDADLKQTLCADMQGFSLHAAVRCGCLKSVSLGTTPCTVSTLCPARGPKAMR